MGFLRNKLTVAIVVLSVAFLVLIRYSGGRESQFAIENGAGAVLSKVQGVVYSINVKVSGFTTLMLNFSEVKNDNQMLRRRNSELEKMRSEYEMVKNENDRLRAKLDFKVRNLHYDYIVCHIIGKGDGAIMDSYIVDKGTKEGVGKGMVVITAEGFVGQVTSVAASYSTIQTLSSENIAVAALVENTKDIDGMVKGYRDLGKRSLAKIYNLPKDSEIKQGDVILTSGQGGLYPRGIRIGSVLEVEEDRGKIMKNAVIQPYVDFTKLEEVMIIVPKDRENMKYQGEDIK